MGNPRKIFTILVAVASMAGPAVADPFDKSPRDLAVAVNDRLRSAGLDLRFELDRCVGREMLECRFSSARTSVVASGRAKPPRIANIMIAADLMATDGVDDVHASAAEATAALGAVMEIFDPALPPSRRSKLHSDLTGSALQHGQSEGIGMTAHYSLAFDQGADGLLTMTIVPKP